MQAAAPRGSHLLPSLKSKYDNQGRVEITFRGEIMAQPLSEAREHRLGPPPAAIHRGTAMKWCRRLLMPVYLLSIASPAKSFRDNPVVGSPALNRLGLHIARKIVADRLGRWRRKRLAKLIPTADRDAFERDGFVVKPNFLDASTFGALRAEIMTLRTDVREAVIGDVLTRLIPLDRRTLRTMPVTRSVLDDPCYRGLLAYVGSFKRRPLFYIQTVFSRYCEAEPDIQSLFHSDTFHPTLKSWLYLEDVPADATPLTYVPGSHRYNRRRLAWERRVSRTACEGSDRLTSEGSLRISWQQIRRLGYPDPQPLPVAANTLIVADTSGIHARGTAAERTMRVAIWAYSRSNPFLPWPGGDIARLPLALLGDYRLRLYWAVSDGLKKIRRVRGEWQWAASRSPLSPP